MARNYFVNIAELTGYSPANHTETVNKRVIGPETVGAKQLEVVLGHVKKNAGALPHAHPGILLYAGGTSTRRGRRPVTGNRAGRGLLLPRR